MQISDRGLIRVELRKQAFKWRGLSSCFVGFSLEDAHAAAYLTGVPCPADRPKSDTVFFSLSFAFQNAGKRNSRRGTFLPAAVYRPNVIRSALIFHCDAAALFVHITKELVFSLAPFSREMRIRLPSLPAVAFSAHFNVKGSCGSSWGFHRL